MNLSKEFDTLNDELLIAKLSADGFNNKSLKLMQFHLTNRWQRIKINKSFSQWMDRVITGCTPRICFWSPFP